MGYHRLNQDKIYIYKFASRNLTDHHSLRSPRYDPLLEGEDLPAAAAQQLGPWLTHHVHRLHALLTSTGKH